MTIQFVQVAWEDYLYWQANDKAMLKRVNELLKEIQRHPFEGKGKPEPLKYHLSQCWSRRINAEHRLVYQVEQGTVTVLQCRYHYS